MSHDGRRHGGKVVRGGALRGLREVGMNNSFVAVRSSRLSNHRAAQTVSTLSQDRRTHHRRWSRYWWVSMTVICSILASTQAALAHNQLIPPGGFNAIDSCDNTIQSPCIRWRKTSSNLSITVHVYLNPSIEDEEINLKGDVRDSIDAYNAIPARNPHMQDTTTFGYHEMVADTYDFDDPRIYGSTMFKPDFFGPGNPNRIDFSRIRFNKLIFWNRSLNFSCYDIPYYPYKHCSADARKVANHEMGHAQGLAHEGSGTTAIMRQGPLTYFYVQADDRDGIIDIYGAYP